MDIRITLYSQISEFESVIDSFNDIHVSLGNGEIEIHEEVATIKEKLAISMQKENIVPPHVESHAYEKKSETVCTLSDEEQKVAVEFVQKSTQFIGLVSTYADFGEIARLMDGDMDLEEEFKSIKNKVTECLLASTILPDEDKQKIIEDLQDKMGLEEDEEPVSKEFDIGYNSLYEYTGKKKNVVVPKGVECIDGWAFYKYRKKLKSIQFPHSLEQIREHAFANFAKLKEIAIPAKVKYIDQRAFCDCKRLAKITFENPDIVKIGHKAFDGTPWLNNALKTDGALIIGSRLVKVDPDIEEYTIPANVTHICGSAFENAKIKSLILPEGISYIGEYAFNGCALEHIELPQSLTCVDKWAFANCEALTELIFPESVTHIGSHALYNLPNCTITILNGSEDEKTEIYDYSFGGKDFLFGDTLPSVKMVKAPYGSKAMRCAMLWNLPFVPLDGTPKNYTYIDEVFCCKGTKLHNYLGHEKVVRVPAGITELGGDSFRNDYSGAEHIILPDSVTTIEACAFCWATSIKIVEGLGVKFLGKYAFGNCENLEKVIFPNLETMSEAAFDRCPSLSEENLHIPEDVVIEERGFSLFSLMQKAMEE